MNIETGLILLESLLLIVTITLILYSIKEGRGRKKLLVEVGKASKLLTRQEYFLTVTDSMMDANSEVLGCITGRPPTADDKKRVRDIIDTIERLTKKGIRVRYLIPKFHDRLHIGYLYTKAGADVQYSSCLMVHNIRFIIVDNKFVVIGIPESIGEKEATKKGYKIPSEGLAMILKNHFNSCEKQISFKEYLSEVMSQTGAAPKHLAHELQIDEKDIERLIG